VATISSAVGTTVMLGFHDTHNPVSPNRHTNATTIAAATHAARRPPARPTQTTSVANPITFATTAPTTMPPGCRPEAA
jgi:hypothetical protein